MGVIGMKRQTIIHYPAASTKYWTTPNISVASVDFDHLNRVLQRIRKDYKQ